jgi:hypothetical protein
VQHRGLLFLTTLEYWGAGAVRVPSVYWGIFQPSRHLCSIARPDWGLISSRDGLAVSFPAIGAKRDGRALMAYSYSGASEGLPNGLGPAYAGARRAVICTRQELVELAALARARAAPSNGQPGRC